MSTAIQEIIERSFYEAIRLQLVADGYTPDILSYPNTEAGYDQYKVDLKAIQVSRGFAVELFGQSNPEDKGYKKLSRVVILSDSFIPGDWGVDPTSYFELGDGSNYDTITPTQNVTHELFMSCYIVADTTAEYRYLTSLINKSLPLRGFLQYHNNTGSGFFTEATSFVDLSSPADGLLEKIYRYRVPDIVWTEDSIDADTVAPIENISLNLWIAHHLGVPGEWSTDPDDYDKTEIEIPEAPPILQYLARDGGEAIVTSTGQLILIK